MHLKSKQTSEIGQKLVSLNEKTEQNYLKVSTLPPFFFKKPLYLLKNNNKKKLSIFYCKNKYPYKFYVFIIKSALGNM